MSVQTNDELLMLPKLVPDGEAGSCSRRRWMMWKKRWAAYTTVAKLGDQSKGEQMARLTCCFDENTLETVDGLEYAAEEDREDVGKNLIAHTESFVRSGGSNRLEFRFVAPNTKDKNFYFRCSFVQSMYIFWENVRSEIIRPRQAGEKKKICEVGCKGSCVVQGGNPSKPSSCNCPRGPAGQKGEMGQSGSPGSPGSPGRKGSKGYKGQRGEPAQLPSNVAGSTSSGKGSRGVRGDPGQKGKPGMRGAQGSKGQPGRKGLQGPRGSGGRKGEKGEAGLDGRFRQHAKGFAGSPGQKGLAGPVSREARRTLEKLQDQVEKYAAQMTAAQQQSGEVNRMTKETDDLEAKIKNLENEVTKFLNDLKNGTSRRGRKEEAFTGPCEPIEGCAVYEDPAPGQCCPTCRHRIKQCGSEACLPKPGCIRYNTTLEGDECCLRCERKRKKFNPKGACSKVICPFAQECTTKFDGKAMCVCRSKSCKAKDEPVGRFKNMCEYKKASCQQCTPLPD